MPETYPYRLKQLELPPPPGSWDTIARRLDTETSAGETAVARKTFHAELTPPPAAWEAIEASLYPAEAESKTPVIPFNFRRIAVAAIAIGLVLTVAWWMLNRPAAETVVAADPVPQVPAPAIKPTPLDPSVKTKAAEGLTAAINNGFQLVKLRSPLRKSINEIVEPVAEVPADPELYAMEENTVLPAELTAAARVSAPLIRDQKGKVILDMNLLTSASSGGYISITGPNGEQTRISRKFANYLIYLNTENSKEEYLDFLIRNSGLWKRKFDDWRTRILNRQSFVPSSSNFFDILELKELLGENQ